MKKRQVPGFMIYRDVMEIMTVLSDEQAGQALRLACRYFNEEPVEDPEDRIVLLALNFFRREIDNSRKQYEVICERNAEIARNRRRRDASGA